MSEKERDISGVVDFQKIYHEYYPKITLYLHRLVGGTDAEDVAQETFVKAGKALNEFRGESSVSTWLYRIATNAATDHLRKFASCRAAKTPAGLDSDSADNEDTISDSDAPVLDALLIRKDMNACIRGIVDGLPESYRGVLVLSEFEGLTNAEIAEVLDISLDAVKIRLHRARTKLRKELEAKCNFYRDERNELACDRKATYLKFLKK